MLTMLSTSTWVVLVIAAAAIGVSKTALPGAATLAVALFAAVLPAKASTGTMLVLLLVGDVLAIWMYRRDADWPTLRRLVCWLAWFWGPPSCTWPPTARRSGSSACCSWP